MMNNLTPRWSTKTEFFTNALLLLFLFLFTAGNMFAQNDERRTTADKSDIVTEFIEKNPDALVVKFYLYDKTNPAAGTMIKTTALLANPENQNLSPADHERMTGQMNEFNVILAEVEKSIQNGYSYEKAFKTHEEKLNKLYEQDQLSTRQDNPNTPQLFYVEPEKEKRSR